MVCPGAVEQGRGQLLVAEAPHPLAERLERRCDRREPIERLNLSPASITAASCLIAIFARRIVHIMMSIDRYAACRAPGRQCSMAIR